MTLAGITPLLTGCGSYAPTEKEAIKFSKEYVLEKYGEDFNADKVIEYPSTGNGTPYVPASGEAKVTDTEKGYSVYVYLPNNEKGEQIPNKIGDNKQISEVKEEVTKEYVDRLFKNFDYQVTYLDVFDCQSMTNGQEKEEISYFTKDSFYKGDLSKFLRENDIGIHLKVDVEIKEYDSHLVESYKKEIEAGLTEILNDFTLDNSFVSIQL